MEILLIAALIAVFLGVSIVAVLNGMVRIAIWVVALSWFVILVSPLFENAGTWFSGLSKPQKPQPKAAQTKPAKRAHMHPVVGWTLFFIASYAITTLILAITGLFEYNDAPFWIIVLSPALPFISVLAFALIKKNIKKRSNRKS